MEVYCYSQSKEGAKSEHLATGDMRMKFSIAADKAVIYVTGGILNFN